MSPDRRNAPHARGAGQDHWSHYVVYILGAAVIGGLLDLYVFELGTPIYGVVGGVIIGLIYILFLRMSQSRRGG